MRIGIDIDGTVYPWTTAAHELVMEKFEIEETGEHDHWDHLARLLTVEQHAWLFSYEAAPFIYGRMDLIYPNAQSVVNELCADHDVHFVTHRSPEKTGAITAEWLARNFVGYKGVHVLDNSVKKYEVLGWDIFIDDKPEIAEEFLTDTMVEVFMPDQPWNREYSNRSLIRFTDWASVPAIVAVT